MEPVLVQNSCTPPPPVKRGKNTGNSQIVCQEVKPRDATNRRSYDQCEGRTDGQGTVPYLIPIHWTHTWNTNRNVTRETISVIESSWFTIPYTAGHLLVICTAGALQRGRWLQEGSILISSRKLNTIMYIERNMHQQNENIWKSNLEK